MRKQKLAFSRNRIVSIPFIVAVTLTIFFFSISVSRIEASGISTGNQYAWSSNLGWINFNPVNGNVIVSDSGLSGYIWFENGGWVNLSPANGGVTNTSNGILGGYAWGENVAWINFSGARIDENGYIRGDAYGDLVGQISFSGTNYGVQTEWTPNLSQLPLTGSLPETGFTVFYFTRKIAIGLSLLLIGLINLITVYRKKSKIKGLLATFRNRVFT